MNLGKTIQAIAFLAFLAERYNIWGPFLGNDYTAYIHIFLFIFILL
jgi:hypothetical protein